MISIGFNLSLQGVVVNCLLLAFQRSNCLRPPAKNVRQRRVSSPENLEDPVFPETNYYPVQKQIRKFISGQRNVATPIEPLGV